MSLPPILMRLKIINTSHHVNVWLPIFLAWIVLLALYIILSQLILILALILWPLGWGEFLLMIGPTIISCLCSLRDLKIDIVKGQEIVLIYFK
jgi:hypothetical protein